MIKLYAYDTFNGRKISVAPEEMELPYAVTVVVDIAKGEQFSEQFLQISPNNKIPAIVDNEGPVGAQGGCGSAARSSNRPWLTALGEQGSAQATC
jgi:glutathione S-transferase